MSKKRGPTCTKLVRMWNRRESHNDVGVYQFITLKIALEQAWGLNKIEANRRFFYCCFGDWSMLAYKISTSEAYMIWRKPIAACKSSANCLVEAGWTPMVSSRYKGRLFHGPWWDPVRMHRNQYMCGAMWDVEHSVAMASLNIYKTTQIFKRRKIW